MAPDGNGVAANGVDRWRSDRSMSTRVAELTPRLGSAITSGRKSSSADRDPTFKFAAPRLAPEDPRA